MRQLYLQNKSAIVTGGTQGLGFEIAKGLSPEKRKQVEAHELKHKQQIEAGRFKWDRSTVTFDKKKYKRTGDGKIVYNGKAYIEGHPTLPWEKEANKVERQVS